MKNLLYLLVSLLLISCHKNDIDPEVKKNEAKWQKKKAFNYTMKQSIHCYCPFGGVKMTVVVQNNVITDVKDSLGASLPADTRSHYKTIDELFKIIHSVDPKKVAAFDVKYHHSLGYPTQLYVDPNKQMADEEYGYATEDLQY